MVKAHKHTVHHKEHTEAPAAISETSTPHTERDIRMYPHIAISRNMHPNRWYAVMILGGLVKIIMLIPVALWLGLVSVWLFMVVIYNSFRVWIFGNYSQYAFTLAVGVMTLGARISFFWAGITDTYPGFSIKDTGLLEFTYPEHPNRMFATPIVGGFIRILMMIPFGLYQRVISTAAYIGVLISCFPVLFTGKYPESTHEIYVDGYRLNFALSAYMLGISDTYPSFRISMNHKWIKIALIIVALLYMLSSNSYSSPRTATAPTYPSPMPSRTTGY